MGTAMEQEGSSGTQAAERLLKVLEIVGSSDDGADVASIAARLGLSLSTTYRLVGVLQRQGYLLRRSQEARYVLGRTVALLGLAVQRQVFATPEVRALLEAARDELGAPIYLTAFHADEIVVAHIADSPEHPRIGQLHTGFADASHVTAFGKLMLAAKSREELDRHFEEHSLRALTPRSATDAGTLREQLETVRHERIAVEVEEYMPRLACIAAPVRSAHGSTIGAVSVSVSAEDFTSRADALERVVRRTAWTVSSRLA
ncbi:IclR family transcriptional regulator [Leifsonia sp. H3M29-4]|uniref:IclR family transcriptional regulator n=1 Tax=Salinibacterium metalliresistens TaxID=3031321 RepID=UPI0023DC17E1|nr:IclR family transcriptional regulator [Salinibacterium metalliresistens]MDF1479208.1 IclR family transcriptional regulator [Salinibacterium metalliresistens]